MRNQTQMLEKALTLDFVTGKGHLARLLEIDHSALNQIMKGTRNMTPRQCILLAEVMGKNALDVIQLAGEDAAKTDAEREWWRRRAPRIFAAIVWGAFAAGLLKSPPAMARHIVTGFSESRTGAVIQSARLVSLDIHYAKFRTAVKAAWATITRYAKGLQALCTPGLQTL